MSQKVKKVKYSIVVEVEYEGYTEEEIDKYLRDSLTEDYWRGDNISYFEKIVSITKEELTYEIPN